VRKVTVLEKTFLVAQMVITLSGPFVQMRANQLEGLENPGQHVERTSANAPTKDEAWLAKRVEMLRDLAEKNESNDAGEFAYDQTRDSQDANEKKVALLKLQMKYDAEVQNAHDQAQLFKNLYMSNHPEVDKTQPIPDIAKIDRALNDRVADITKGFETYRDRILSNDMEVGLPASLELREIDDFQE
jgi:hypothetical protein